MATTSIADKLAKLEKKIAKRQATISEEQTQLDKELAEYDRLYLTALANKYKLSGKDLFSANCSLRGAYDAKQSAELRRV